MSSETPHGYPYPEDSDRVMDGAAAMQALAEAADEKAGIAAAGAVTVAVTATQASNAVAVTFPSGRFSEPPAVVVGLAYTITYAAAATSITTTGFTLTAGSASGSTLGAARNIGTRWIARSID